MRGHPDIVHSLRRKAVSLHRRVHSNPLVVWLGATAALLIERTICLPRNVRRTVAIGLSAGMHLGVLLMLVLQLPLGTGPVGGIGHEAGARLGAGDGMDVVLTAATRLEAVTVRPLETVDIDEAVLQTEPLSEQMLLDASAGEILTLNGDGLAPPEALTAETTVTSQDQKTGPNSSENHTETSNAETADSSSGGLPGQAMTELWKAIEPCWKRLADNTTAGVTMSVSFTQLGNLAAMPVSVSENGTLLESTQSASESVAIRALAQCGPYLMVYGRDNVQIAFPTGG